MGRSPTQDGWSDGQSGIRVYQSVRTPPKDAPERFRGKWRGMVGVELDIGRPVFLTDALSLHITPDVESREEAMRLVEAWTRDLCPSEEPVVLSGLRRGCGCGSRR
jgi:hypothetical protein